MSIIPQMPPATARVLTAAGTFVSDWFRYLRDAALYGFFESIFCKGTIESQGDILVGTDPSVVYAGAAGRRNLAIRGTTGCGVNELSTREADANGVVVGVHQFADVNSTATDPRVAAIRADLEGITANRRGGCLKIFTRSDNANTMSERARINEAGNVGIGTNQPDGKLHLSSGTSGDCVLVLEADTDNNDENDVPQIWFKADGDLNEALIGLNNNFLDIVSNVTSGGGIRFFLGTTSNYGTTSPDTGAAEAARFSSAGNLGIGGTPNAVAILDLQSTTKGFKLPVMTTAQRTAITAVRGLMVYDSDTGKSYTYDGANWNAHY